MNRQGHAIIACLAAISLLGLSAGHVAVERVQRMRSVDERVRRLQGREWALGAMTLAPGTTFTSDGWIVRHDHDAELKASTWTATGPRGTYTITADRERWVPRRRDTP